jgi:hypothetical protein
MGVAVALLAVAMLASPVLAIGPENAENSNSPNIVFTDYSVQIRTPSGFINEWIIDDPSHVMIKTATEFYIGNAYAPSSASEIQLNKWNYLSSQVFYQFLISPDVGFDPAIANYVAFVLNPNGVYYKEAYTGPQ